MTEQIEDIKDAVSVNVSEKKVNFVTSDELKDKYFGPIGTPRRDAFEIEAKHAIAAEIKKQKHRYSGNEHVMRRNATKFRRQHDTDLRKANTSVAGGKNRK